MSQIICLNEKCPHRSKRPLKKWRMSDGKYAYSCSLPVTIVQPLYDCDGEIVGALGYRPIECRQYKKDKEKELIDNEQREAD